jgi:branched-chain amino acid transport system substrate-binding protein
MKVMFGSGHNSDQDQKKTSRRDFLRAAAMLAGSAAIVGCRKHSQGNRTAKIGYVAPKTGSLAAFCEADPFVLGGIRRALAGGLIIAGRIHPVEIYAKDSMSDPNRAAEVAAELINSVEVDLLLTSNTPETVSPVSDQAEINGVPCISTDAPWQPYFFGRGGKLDRPFEWTYHFFWGVDQLATVYSNMWASLPTNKTIGALWGNDNDGNAFSDPKTGFPPVLAARGFKIVDPGRFPSAISDFSAQIIAFKNANVEICTGVLAPPQFATFWSQAAQQGFRPKIVTFAKALLFPAAIESLGGRGSGLSSEVWWSPNHPFRSSVTNQSAAEFCADYERQTGKQWTQPMGYKHALFSVAIDVLKRVTNIDSPESIRDAIRATSYDSIVGRIQWTGNPVANVCRTPLVGGQWVRGSHYPYDLQVVNDEGENEIPTRAALQPLDDVNGAGV